MWKLIHHPSPPKGGLGVPSYTYTPTRQSFGSDFMLSEYSWEGYRVIGSQPTAS